MLSDYKVISPKKTEWFDADKSIPVGSEGSAFLYESVPVLGLSSGGTFEPVRVFIDFADSGDIITWYNGGRITNVTQWTYLPEVVLWKTL